MVNLFRLAVNKEHRDKGVATKLMSYIEEYLQSVGVCEIGLYVDSENETLKKFYEKREFTNSHHKFYYMWKELGK